MHIYKNISVMRFQGNMITWALNIFLSCHLYFFYFFKWWFFTLLAVIEGFFNYVSVAIHQRISQIKFHTFVNHKFIALPFFLPWWEKSGKYNFFLGCNENWSVYIKETRITMGHSFCIWNTQELRVRQHCTRFVLYVGSGMVCLWIL